MSYPMPRPGRPVVAAALALFFLFLLAVVAVPQARADGEDDPTFGNLGTAHLALGDVSLLSDPDADSSAPMPARSDQGPDGAIYSALGLIDNDARGGDEFVRLIRMDAAGKASGLDGDGMVDVDYGDLRRLLDIEVLADGSIIVVTQSDSLDGRGFSSPPVEIRTFNASGSEVGDPRQFLSPDLCGPDGQARAADTDAQGRVFVAWDSCFDGKGSLPAVLARYDGEDDDTATMLVRNIEELVLGPQNLIYALSLNQGGIFFPPKSSRSVFESSEVSRYDTEDVESDTDYGQEGIARIDGSLPIDLTVDPSGRAVVWAHPFFVTSRGDEGQTWHFYRFDNAGESDAGWGEEGHAAIQHPEFGSLFQCFGGSRGGFNCGEEPQVIAQSDSKVVAIGYPPDPNEQEQRGSEPPRPDSDRTIIRLTAAGALDPAWSLDGVRGFAIAQPPDGSATFDALGPPTLQSDGKLLIPIFTFAREDNARIPTPPDGQAFGVSRIGLSPPAPPVVVTEQQQPAAVIAAQRSCVSRRVFRIRLRTGRRKAERSAIKTVRVTVNGKSVPVSKGARRRAQVDLRNLPKGRFTVIIRMTLADGGKVRDTRRYRTCTPKRARELPALRTRKPRRR